MYATIDGFECERYVALQRTVERNNQITPDAATVCVSIGAPCHVSHHVTRYTPAAILGIVTEPEIGVGETLSILLRHVC